MTWIRRINAHYGTEIEATKVYSHPTLKQLSHLVASETSMPVAAATRVEANAATASTTVAVTPSPDVDGLDGVIVNLKTMLAKELLLRPDEIDDSVSFIDLGLDSITGVTWVRRINEHYGTDIEATNVYGHPTLREMGRLVKREAERGGTTVNPIPATAVTVRMRSAVQVEPAVRRTLPS